MCRNATHCLTVGLWHPERTTLEPEENKHMEIVIKKKLNSHTGAVKH